MGALVFLKALVVRLLEPRDSICTFEHSSLFEEAITPN